MIIGINYVLDNGEMVENIIVYVVNEVENIIYKYLVLSIVFVGVVFVVDNLIWIVNLRGGILVVCFNQIVGEGIDLVLEIVIFLV